MLVTAVHPHSRGEHLSTFRVCAVIVGSSPQSWGTQQPRVLRALCARFIPTVVGNTIPMKPFSVGSTVHPHSRGEHFNVGFIAQRFGGSSPQSWGTPKTFKDSTSNHRFIPTVVGNTAPEEGDEPLSTVHPHSRGEHRGRRCRRSSVGGSSPQSWGTPDPILGPIVDARFIPTVVGNTMIPLLIAYCITVHPHSRGEHKMSTGGGTQLDGSSPQSWGTQ